MGGVGVIVGVLEGVGDGTVAEGVKVKVGSGVRDGTGVAVRRGVALTSGESVFVGTPLMALGCSGVVQLASSAANSVTINQIGLGLTQNTLFCRGAQPCAHPNCVNPVGSRFFIIVSYFNPSTIRPD
jgi:hypothetical protein